jgi:hypothetical protein
MTQEGDELDSKEINKTILVYVNSKPLSMLFYKSNLMSP